MKQTYIKPNTEMHALELQQMRALSGDEPNPGGSDKPQLGKEDNDFWFSGKSQWDSDEEE